MKNDLYLEISTLVQTSNHPYRKQLTRVTPCWVMGNPRSEQISLKTIFSRYRSKTCKNLPDILNMSVITAYILFLEFSCITNPPTTLYSSRYIITYYSNIFYVFVRFSQPDTITVPQQPNDDQPMRVQTKCCEWFHITGPSTWGGKEVWFEEVQRRYHFVHN